MPVLDGDFEAFVTNLGKYNEGMLWTLDEKSKHKRGRL